MIEVPLPPSPSMTLTCLLGGQNTRLNIYQLSTGLYMDVILNDAPIVTGVICRDAAAIVRDSYLGFRGDLVWNDTQAMEDPYYEGIGTRWRLFYLP